MKYTELISSGIKKIRLSKKLTQEVFAEKINMSVQGYRNIEQGKYLPTAQTIDKICECFDIQPIDLLTPTPNENTKEFQDLIVAKIKNLSLDKLVKVNQIIDLL